MEQTPSSLQSDSIVDRINRWLRTSMMLKLAVIGILVYVFKNVRLTVLFSGVLALLYGFFYSLL